MRLFDNVIFLGYLRFERRIAMRLYLDIWKPELKFRVFRLKTSVFRK